MAIRIFYHVCALNHWEMLLKEQVAKLIFSGLVDAADAVHCVCVGPEARKASLLLRVYGPKFTIEVSDPEDKTAERLTLRTLHAIVQEEDKVLYLHTKGTTKIPPSENVYWWNFYMEYFLIKGYRTCLDALETCDVVGVDYYPESLPHFSGNFWWARGKHLRRLEPPALQGDKYTNTETWVCGGSQGLEVTVCQLLHSHNDHYTTAIFPRCYMESSSSSSSL